MEVTFTLDRDDIWEFEKHVLIHTPRQRTRLVATCAAVFLGTFLHQGSSA